MCTYHLRQIGEVLCRYEVEKRCAVDMEDYDSARKKKARSPALPFTNITSTHSLPLLQYQYISLMVVVTTIVSLRA